MRGLLIAIKTTISFFSPLLLLLSPPRDLR